MNSIADTEEPIDFGPRIGLIGDAHGNRRFLEDAIVSLADHDVTSIVQLGDWGTIWTGNSQELHSIKLTNRVLELTGLTMYVVLGNHEGYDAIEELPANAHGVRGFGSTRILPPSGRATAAGRPIGWLAGAASIDRGARRPGTSWWRQEIPLPEETRAFTDGGPADIVFAHDALSTPELTQRLAPSRHLWSPPDVDYAERTQDLFTERVLAVLSNGGVVCSGHYHFRQSIIATIDRPNGGSLTARNEIFSCEREGPSVGILDAESLDVTSWEIDAVRPRLDMREFIRFWKLARHLQATNPRVRAVFDSIPRETWRSLTTGGNLDPPRPDRPTTRRYRAGGSGERRRDQCPDSGE